MISSSVKKSAIPLLLVVLLMLLLPQEPFMLVQAQEATADSSQARSAAEESIDEVEKELKRRQLELFKLKLRWRVERESGSASPSQMQQHEEEELQLVKDTIRDYGLNHFAPDFEVLSRPGADVSASADNSAIFSKYSRVFDALKDFYFEYS